MGKRVTNQQKILGLYYEGKSPREIYKEVGVSLRCVYRVLAKYKPTRRAGRMCEEVPQRNWRQLAYEYIEAMLRMDIISNDTPSAEPLKQFYETNIASRSDLNRIISEAHTLIGELPLTFKRGLNFHPAITEEFDTWQREYLRKLS